MTGSDAKILIATACIFLSVHAISQNNFPGCVYTKVVVYELNGSEKSSRARSVFTLQTGKSKEITKEEVSGFLSIINNKNSYGHFSAACHDPRIGLVFYDQDEQPCAYLSLCLECNNMYSEPPIRFNLEYPNAFFSLDTRKKLRAIFKSWGFPDVHFSPLFDDAEQLRIAMKAMGKDSLEIEEMVKYYFGDH